MNTKNTVPGQSKEPMGFIGGCRSFFGFMPGQSLAGFRDEVAKLTVEDRKEIDAGMRANGVEMKPFVS